MIVNKSVYECPKCEEQYFFDTSTNFKAICKNCQCDLIFQYNCDCDTEQAEKLKNTPPYDPTQDPNSPYYMPIIKCPTCQSTNVQKIGTGERVVSVATMGIFSKKINKSFKCKSCGYTW